MNSIFMCAVEKAGKGSKLGATSSKAVKQARVLKQPSVIVYTVSMDR